MTWLLVFVVMLLVVLAMAIGVIMGRRPIAGSCGGLATLGVDREHCPICGGDPEKCENADDDDKQDASPGFTSRQ